MPLALKPNPSSPTPGVADPLPIQPTDLRLILDEHAIYAVTDAAGTILEANDRFCTISGYARHELLGQNHRLLNSGHHPRAFWTDMFRTLTAGRTWRGEVCNRAKDGSLYWVHTTNIPLAGPTGRIEKYVSLRVVITDLKALQQRADDSRSVLKAVLDSLSSHLAVLDEHGTIIEVNEGWNRFAERNAASCGPPTTLGVNYLAVCDGAAGSPEATDARAAADGIRAVLQGRAESFTTEYPCHSPTERRWFTMTVRPLAGGRKGAVVVHKSVTETHLARELVTRQTAELERLSLVARHTKNIIIIADADRRVVWTNDAFTRLTGYTLDEVRGLNPGKLLQSDKTDPATVALLRDRLHQGRECRTEILNRAKDGTEYWLDIEVQPVRADDGRLQGFVAIETEITERKRIEAENARLMAFQSAILRSAGFSIIAVDSSGIITHFNDAAERMLGYAAADVVARTCPAMFHDPAEVAARAEELTAELARPVPAGFETFVAKARLNLPDIREWTYVRRDGSRFPVMLSITALRDAAGATSGFLGVAADVTELKRMQQELLTAREAAEVANEAKSLFLANMSHEIRTPMTAILGFADMLRDDPAPVEGGLAPAPADPALRREAVDTIVRNGHHLLAIINDILDLSKIEAGKLTVESVPTDVRGILADVVATQLPRAQAKAIALTLTADPGLPAALRTDPVRLKQVLTNLVGNAVKFTEQGTVRVEVDLLRADPTDVARVADRIRITVRDSGIGMTPDQLARLFQPFSQADPSMSRRFGGTGLGLSISHRLAHMLGGTLTASSDYGLGSAFTLDLPATPAVHDPNTPAVRPPLQPTPPTALPKPLAGVRVLLAEDGEDNRKLVSYHLKRAGATVVPVENGQLALDLLRSGEPFSVVLLDMQMPVMDGYAAARGIRAWELQRAVSRTRDPATGALPPRPHVRVVALTAHAMSGDREKCLNAGCDDYLTKPVDPARLVAACRPR